MGLYCISVVIMLVKNSNEARTQPSDRSNQRWIPDYFLQERLDHKSRNTPTAPAYQWSVILLYIG